jgi:hypothetical protein
LKTDEACDGHVVGFGARAEIGGGRFGGSHELALGILDLGARTSVSRNHSIIEESE